MGTYNRFIRAVTAAIAMAITGGSRWVVTGIKFWDYRPFTRVVRGFRNYITLKDYVAINELEGQGVRRETARQIIAWRTAPPS